MQQSSHRRVGGAAQQPLSCKEMDKMLQALHRQVSGGPSRSLGSRGEAVMAPPPPPQNPQEDNLQHSSSVLAEERRPTAVHSGSELSEAASTILHDIERFDLFAEGRCRDSLVATERKGNAQRQRGASAVPLSSTTEVRSSRVGSDDPIPRDAPSMSDAVMHSSSGVASGDYDHDIPGSRVTYVGKQSGGGSAQFAYSLQRATQSVYFEELQYQIV